MEDKETKQTVCKRCGRKLKSKKAIEIGMGATCFKKSQQNLRKKLWEEMEYDERR